MPTNADPRQFSISIELDQNGEIHEQISGAFMASQSEVIASHLILLASRIRNATRRQAACDAQTV